MGTQAAAELSRASDRVSAANEARDRERTLRVDMEKLLRDERGAVRLTPRVRILSDRGILK